MLWNWQLPSWPKFTYNSKNLAQKERRFLLGLGGTTAFLKNLDKSDYERFIVEILSQEGIESSKIEGEVLDRESLQSSIKRHFGLNLNVDSRREGKKESGMAELLCSVYESYQQPLTHEMLWNWHSMLFKDHSQIDEPGKYRTHIEPMQIVSRRYDQPKVFFEAPPSAQVPHEMTLFIDWFNSAEAFDSILGRAAIAHVYFESIHPFEDGNGRVGRALVEKILSQGIGKPALIAVSKVLEQRKKEYYAALEKCNQTLEAEELVDFFSDAILQAAGESIRLLNFLIEKAKILLALSGQLNARQEKSLLRIFEAGPSGFKGGLSAENYIAITKTSRATATRDLADLVAKGALVKTGELRHTRYWLKIQ
ncbi:MAG: Fic family protein [Parachlamydiaceae bacterium]|nr:Fic family protein [Parachlamydiaceae bacterium]